MQSTLQHVYATNLKQKLGYPLRNPQPDKKLGEPHKSEGFQIGDVGHVDQYGEFNLLFNIKFPPEERLEWGFPPKKPKLLDPVPRESPKPDLGHVDQATLVQMASAATEEPHKPDFTHFDRPIFKRALDPNKVFRTGVAQEDVGDARIDRSYRFTATCDAGAILILPDGAELFELEDQYLTHIRNHVTKHASDWCRYYDRDSLYLVTATYKTNSWTLGSFDRGLNGGKIHVHHNETATSVYTWSSTFDVDSQQAPKGNFYRNQAVFIKGLKMKVRHRDLLSIERLEPPEGWFARLLSQLRLKAHKLLSGPSTKIEYFPALNFSEPSHPLDIVNHVLLDENPGAQMAVTHDNDWIEMLENGLPLADLMEEISLRNFMAKNYRRDLDSEHNTVCLQRNSERSAIFEREPSPEHGEETNGGSKADDQVEAPSDNSRLVITNMRLENVDVGHIDAAVCVLVQFGATTRRTQNKPHASIIEWDDEIMLPSDMPVHVVVCGTFQLGSTLGTREISARQTINTSDMSGSTYKIRFFVGDPDSRSSLLVTLERHFSYFESYSSHEETSVFVEKTILGFKSFYSYHMAPKEEYINAALECFRHALDQCGLDDARRATARFNLATSEFIRCQSNGTYSELDKAIDLYREALELREERHPDRPATLLLLAQALLSRHSSGLEYDESIAEDIELLLAELHHDDSRDRRSADAILATCRFYRSVNAENPAGVDGLFRDWERGAYIPPYGYFDRPRLLHKLGVAFWRRFQSSGNLDDLDKSIELNAEALQVPDGHDDRKSVIACLGNSLLCALEARGELTDLDMSVGLAALGKKVVTKLSDAIHAQGAEAPLGQLQEQINLMSAVEKLREQIELMSTVERLREQIELMSTVERLRDQVELTSAPDKLRDQIMLMSAADDALQDIVKQGPSLLTPEIQIPIDDWSQEGTPTACKRELGMLLSFLEGEGERKMRKALEELELQWPYKAHKIAGTMRALEGCMPYFHSVLATQLRCSVEGWD